MLDKESRNRCLAYLKRSDYAKASDLASQLRPSHSPPPILQGNKKVGQRENHTQNTFGTRTGKAGAQIVKAVSSAKESTQRSTRKPTIEVPILTKWPLTCNNSNLSSFDSSCIRHESRSCYYRHPTNQHTLTRQYYHSCSEQDNLVE